MLIDFLFSNKDSLPFVPGDKDKIRTLNVKKAGGQDASEENLSII